MQCSVDFLLPRVVSGRKKSIHQINMLHPWARNISATPQLSGAYFCYFSLKLVDTGHNPVIVEDARYVFKGLIEIDAGVGGSRPSAASDYGQEGAKGEPHCQGQIACPEISGSDSADVLLRLNKKARPVIL
jgi:hypothetical protein